MPGRTRRRQNRPQGQQKEAAPSRANQGQSRSKKQQRISFWAWLTSPAAQWTGIGAIVVAVIAALVVFGVRPASGGDFEFSMYRGSEVVGGSELEFSHLFPSGKPLVLNFWARRCTTSIRAISSFGESI